MEKDTRHFLHQLHRHRFPLDHSLFDIPLAASHLNTKHVCLYPPRVEDSRSGSIPFFPLCGMQEQDATEPNGSQNWLSIHSRLNFAPILSSPLTEKLITGPHDLGKQGSPTISTAPAQKRFLVFDRSGDRTTFCYTSGIETPVQCGMPKPSTAFNKGGLWDSSYPSRLITNDEHIEDTSRATTEDEMHEDTEELNALLCSDSESYSSDGEETSTAHSPSTMTDNCVEDLIEEAGEEVDSFGFPPKRRKLWDGGHDVSSQAFAGSPLKSHMSSGLDDDTGSNCGSGNEPCTDFVGSLSGSKRSRKERIRETLNILQNIIPSAKGKDAIVVIDEAIHYLKSLKVKAKASGLNSL